MLFVNIAETLALNARRRPDHPAIVHGGKIVDYAGLARRVGQMATCLVERGVGAGDLVGVCLKDSPDHLVAMLACARIGAVILPMDWRWGPAEKRNLADWFAPRLTLIEPDGPAIGQHVCVALDDDFQARRGRADPCGAPLARAGDPGLLLSLSSGTTGRPKGPLLTHRLVQNRFIQHWAALGFHEQERHLVSTPLYFGGGRMFALSHLFIGATVVLAPPPYTPEELVAIVATERISTLFIVPTMLRRLLALPAGDAPLLGGPRAVIAGGAALHVEERARALERVSPRLVNYYSSSEGGGVSLLLPAHDGESAASVGRPMFMTQVEIVDRDDATLAAGETGLVRYRGPGVPDALYKDEENTRELFRAGWFYPGDVGRFDARGFLYLTGRAKDMIIRGGVNIYPQEIERAILGVSGVEDAAVAGWPSAAFGEEIAAFVVAAPGVTAERVLAHCRAELAPYKAPRDVFFLDALPKNSAGKTLKNVLAKRLTPLT